MDIEVAAVGDLRGCARVRSGAGTLLLRPDRHWHRAHDVLILRPIRIFRRLLAVVALSSTSCALAANVPVVGEVNVVEVASLRFGGMIVQSGGRRTVTPNGAVIDEAVIAPSGSSPAPAEYIVSYDRGNNGRQPLDVEFLVFLPGSLRVDTGNLSAVLEAITADVRSQGNARQFTLRVIGCVTRVCSASFRLGGTMAVTRQSGGGSIVIAIPVTAMVSRLSRTHD